MRGILIAAALGFGVLGAAIAAAGPASASGEGDRHSYGASPGSNSFGVVIIGSQPYQEQEHQRPDFFNRPRLKMWERPPSNLWQRPSHDRWEQPRHDDRQVYRYKHKKAYKYADQFGYQAFRPCRQTSKIGFDNYGRRARIGSVVCYDPYGRPYIVQGSRFIIHYF